VPLVTVVMPTFNNAGDIQAALNSLCEQSFTDFSVVVVDNGSTDATEATVRPFAERLDLSYIREIRALGPAAARNIGISSTDSELVAFLDADDYWLPEKLMVSVRAMTDGADVSHHDVFKEYSNSAFRFRHSRSRQLASPVLQDLFINGNAIFTSSVTIRRELLKVVSGFEESEEFKSIEDFDLWLRVARLTNKFTYIPKALSVYRISEASHSDDLEGAINGLNAVYGRYSKVLGVERYSDLPHWFSDYLFAKCKSHKKYSEILSSGMLSFSPSTLSLLRSWRLRLGIRYLKVVRLVAILSARIQSGSLSRSGN